MISFDAARATLAHLVGLGGPVVALLLLLSVIAGAVVLYKFWQYAVGGVGCHRRLEVALDRWQAGDRAVAEGIAREARSYVQSVIIASMSAAKRQIQSSDVLGKLEADAETELSRLESGFRILDSIAQVAPLLGLFGTVLGMIDAFRALQDAGQSVDPSVLAGGIWVALLTTAVGLAVAIPSALFLTWFESRVARERIFLDRAIQTILAPAEAIKAEASAVTALKAARAT
ncbi:MotA/TolQ/ExbB proton channel family protein [Qingshengfaniella alkalisoli]|uniref:MotA/TolQ/ExbB proton channel family protein n=1 Tax=Qingshengfaniella alkalisoli TaxID=2599296 RepID=A0A5B8I4Y0_9RHOB|nr:MotA/TolQ/ExbB proton channel family protein [Qingshengfaniella alkalisoli]QDY68235.1 MotA/TolQ/ExbB proton channel family protein [Qingshengfaniella alkalisoli]